MPKVTITEIPPWDGEYRLDLEALTNEDLHRIKVLSGVRAGEIPEAVAAIDSDLICALALITVETEKQLAINPRDFWAAKVGGVRIDFDFKYPDEIEKEAEERKAAGAVPPPPLTSENEPQPQPSTSSDSGQSSTDTSDSNQSVPSPTGDLGLETAAASASETSHE